MLTAAKRPGIGCGQRIVIGLPILAAGAYDVMPFQSAACTASYGIIRPAGQQYRAVALHQAPLAVLAHGIISIRNQIIFSQHNAGAEINPWQLHSGIAACCCRAFFRSRNFGRYSRSRRCSLCRSWCRCVCHRIRRFRCTSNQQQSHSCTKYPFHRFHSLLFLIYKDMPCPYCVTSSRYSMLTQPYHPAYLLSIQVLSSLWPKSCRQVCAGTNCHLL